MDSGVGVGGCTGITGSLRGVMYDVGNIGLGPEYREHFMILLRSLSRDFY